MKTTHSKTIQRKVEADKRFDEYSYSPYKGHWVYTAKGYCHSYSGLHTIHEDTAGETLRAMRNVKPCSCEECGKA